MACVMLDYMQDIAPGCATEHVDKITVSIGFWQGRDVPSNVFFTPEPGKERALANAFRECAAQLDAYADKRAMAAEFDPALLAAE